MKFPERFYSHYFYEMQQTGLDVLYLGPLPLFQLPAHVSPLAGFVLDCLRKNSCFSSATVLCNRHSLFEQH